MTYQPRTHELGLYSASGRRPQPRDARGRFVRVRYSADRFARCMTEPAKALRGLPAATRETFTAARLGAAA